MSSVGCAGDSYSAAYLVVWTGAPLLVQSAATNQGATGSPRTSRVRALVRTRWFTAVVVATLAFLVVTELDSRPESVADLAWLMHTGAIVFLIALGAARRIPPAVPLTVRRIRIVDGNGVEGSHEPEVMTALEVIRRRYAKIGIPVGAALMAAFWLWVYGDRVWGWPLFWLELAAAGGAGYVVGGFVAYGRLGHVLDRLRLKPLVIPGHPDGAAGLRPVGALYLRQAMIVALIGVFAGVWWLLIPIVGRWWTWRDPYLCIVLVCLVLEAAALFLPLASFHRRMAEQRTELLLEADDAARRVARADEVLWRTQDPGELSGLESERERARGRWQAIETMPTWPLDTQIRRRFAWSNVAMLVPVVLQMLNAPQLLQQVMASIGGY